MIRFHLHPLTRAGLPLLAAAVLLQACGGGSSARGPSTAGAGDTATRATVLAYPPLLDDDGHPQPSIPAAVPADPGAQTRRQLYASPAQAEQLLRAVGDGAVRVETGCCGADAVHEAVNVVHGVVVANGLGHDAPVLVYGADPRLAATLVNTLTETGYTQAWLVTR